MQVEFEPRFSLSELEEASGLTQRTIRLYVSRGLIPAARGRGRSRYYAREHLEALARVSDYRNQGLSLDEIAEAIGRSSPARLQSGAEWRRFELADGIELHVRDDVTESQALLVQAMLDIASRAATLDR